MLDYVGDVEEGGVGVGEEVGLGDVEGGVLDWYVEVVEGDYFVVVGEVEVVEGGFLEVSLGGCGGGGMVGLLCERRCERCC